MAQNSNEHPLAKWRASRNMTQEAFAEALKVAPNTIWRWENKKQMPRREDIERVAAYTGLSASEILGMEAGAQ